MALRSLFVYPRFPAKLARLLDLAYNLWTFWDSEALKLFERIDPSAFRLVGRSPIEFLHALSQARLAELAKDTAFLRELEKVWRRYGEAMQPPITPRIAYFSMEFGLPKLPIYAGGLGMLAGDHLKGASDMGLPIIGVGIYYRYGYFVQRISVDGHQEEVYREINPHYTPIQEWKTPDDQSVFVTITVGGQPIRLKLWRVQVGRVSLLLLDANVPENPPELQAVTNYLYDADRDRRIMQEIVLGQGGFRALEAVGIQPEVFHLNEGHSAFLIIERLRKLIREQGYGFDEACAIVKSTTVFTTHTPVEAGNENFPERDDPQVPQGRRRGAREEPRHVRWSRAFCATARRSGCPPSRSASPATSTGSPACTPGSRGRCGRTCSRAVASTRSPSRRSPTASTARGWPPRSAT